MAFGSLGGSAGIGVGTANQASFVYGVTTTSVAAGNLAVFLVGGDNFQTTDGDEGMVTSVTDNVGNVWVKAREFCNGQGTAQTGSTCSMWYTIAKAALAAGSGLVTANFSNATSRDDMCAALRVYSITAGNTVRVAASNALANDAADPGSLDAVAAVSKEYLRVRGISSEINSVAALTVTASWTTWALTVRSRNNALAQTLRAEHRIAIGAAGASNPTYASADHASVYVAFEEVPPLPSHSGIQELDVPMAHFRRDMIDMDA